MNNIDQAVETVLDSSGSVLGKRKVTEITVRINGFVSSLFAFKVVQPSCSIERI